MSRQPEPPASIAAAIRSVLSGNDIVDEECITEQAQAVWDALLADGRIVYQSKPGSAPLEQDWEWEPGLWLPLPVVEPRDTEQPS